MTQKEKEIITDLKKCNFRDMCEYFKAESEKRKNRTKEEKQVCRARYKVTVDLMKRLHQNLMSLPQMYENWSDLMCVQDRKRKLRLAECVFLSTC